MIFCALNICCSLQIGKHIRLHNESRIRPRPRRNLIGRIARRRTPKTCRNRRQRRIEPKTIRDRRRHQGSARSGSGNSRPRQGKERRPRRSRTKRSLGVLKCLLKRSQHRIPNILAQSRDINKRFLPCSCSERIFAIGDFTPPFDFDIARQK